MGLKAQKVFLTGGSGFIGAHLRARLTSAGYQVFAPEIRIEDPREIEAKLATDTWSFVIHLAAQSSYAHCEEKPFETLSVNTTGTALLARSVAKIHPTSHFIFASTAQVYSPKIDHAATSDFIIDENCRTAPANFYPQSKLFAEAMLREISLDFGLKTTVLRIFNHSHKSQKPDFFLPHIYQELVKAKAQHTKHIPVGNMDVSRDIGSVSDLVEAFSAILTASEKLPNFEIMNVCSGQARSLRRLAQLLAQTLEVTVDFTTDSSRLRPGEIPSVRGSYEKLHRLTGWQPQTKSDEDLIRCFLAD
jgi:GDP-4-dehydro-6-deoxy-D-mannose reductase